MPLNKKKFKQLKQLYKSATLRALEEQHTRIKQQLALCPSPGAFERYIKLCERLGKRIEL